MKSGYHVADYRWQSIKQSDEAALHILLLAAFQVKRRSNKEWCILPCKSHRYRCAGRCETSDCSSRTVGAEIHEILPMITRAVHMRSVRRAELAHSRAAHPASSACVNVPCTAYTPVPPCACNHSLHSLSNLPLPQHTASAPSAHSLSSLSNNAHLDAATRQISRSPNSPVRTYMHLSTYMAIPRSAQDVDCSAAEPKLPPRSRRRSMLAQARAPGWRTELFMSTACIPGAYRTSAHAAGRSAISVPSQQQQRRRLKCRDPRTGVAASICIAASVLAVASVRTTPRKHSLETPGRAPPQAYALSQAPSWSQACARRHESAPQGRAAFAAASCCRRAGSGRRRRPHSRSLAGQEATSAVEPPLAPAHACCGTLPREHRQHEQSGLGHA
jgi:hypothetical protein